MHLSAVSGLYGEGPACPHLLALSIGPLAVAVQCGVWLQYSRLPRFWIERQPCNECLYLVASLWCGGPTFQFGSWNLPCMHLGVSMLHPIWLGTLRCNHFEPRHLKHAAWNCIHPMSFTQCHGHTHSITNIPLTLWPNAEHHASAWTWALFGFLTGQGPVMPDSMATSAGICSPRLRLHLPLPPPWHLKTPPTCLPSKHKLFTAETWTSFLEQQALGHEHTSTIVIVGLLWVVFTVSFSLISFVFLPPAHFFFCYLGEKNRKRTELGQCIDSLLRFWYINIYTYVLVFLDNLFQRQDEMFYFL